MQKKHFYIALFLLLSASIMPCQAQSNEEPAWPDSLHTAKDADYLTADEQGVIYEMNKVRTNPKAYVEVLKKERVFYNKKNIEKPGEITLVTQEGLAALDECIAALKKARPVGMLKPHDDLSKAAAFLGKDQAKTGKVGHVGSDRITMPKRITRYYTGDYVTIGENINYGTKKPQLIVMQLLIDDGVSSRGHRKNIMSPDFNYCGVSINPHSKYGFSCVIDYMGKNEE